MRYILFVVLVGMLAACGGAEQAPVTPESEAPASEHMLSDQQRALDRAKEAAEALEKATADEAERIRQATD